MPKDRPSVRDLSQEAELEVDETLLLLWDQGLTYLNDPADRIRPRDITECRRTLGLTTPQDLKSIKYWAKQLDLSETDFRTHAADLGIRISDQARTLPKGAVSRLKKAARSQKPPTPRLPPPTAPREPEPPIPPLEWSDIGHRRELRFLTEEEVARIHFTLVADFRQLDDPIDPPGIRNEHLLSSAVHRPRTSLDQVVKYPTVEMSAAALLHALVHDHPFHNGNKRTALVAVLVFLDENGYTLDTSQDELFRFVLQLAQHRLVPRGWGQLADREVQAAALWITERCRRLEHGERPIPFRKLRRILTAFGCDMTQASGVGNRMNISRTITDRNVLGMTRQRTLRTQIWYADEGREVKRNSLNKVRKELHLDDEHGYDSKRFYAADPSPVDDFIVTYRKTLLRLARL